MNTIGSVLITLILLTTSNGFAAKAKKGPLKPSGLSLSLPNTPSQNILTQLINVSRSQLSINMKTLKSINLKAQNFIKNHKGQKNYLERVKSLKDINQIYKFAMNKLKVSGSYTRAQANDLVELLTYTQNSTKLFLNSKKNGWSNQQIKYLSQITESIRVGTSNNRLSSLRQVLVHFPNLKSSILQLKCTI